MSQITAQCFSQGLAHCPHRGFPMSSLTWGRETGRGGMGSKSDNMKLLPLQLKSADIIAGERMEGWTSCIFYVCMSACVCVCVCVWERERCSWKWDRYGSSPRREGGRKERRKEVFLPSDKSAWAYPPCAVIRGDRTEQDCPHLIWLPEWNSHWLLQTQL